ncbi:Protein of unknown function [Arenibacter palladensis]|jgi:energy-coupling factor transporter ATP-binding protein EcfA2|uniref:Uncharacterized protein n=2 Tax=Arenibacter TaxID=178469 RepID=A0A1X7IWS2_9FLAO|nr:MULTISPECIES: DUF1456 family protein [Arenibacter]MDO6604664.1 DUF1456 family protein [Arenibacter palladensis]MDX1767000.1 DUF1456 family protein [Arenibacter troitsensis]SHF34025.1 Protein of unknown function [Arenibacter palladensis]SMG19279.1 Protein of unknown function [Arenibacter troitsensis]|tara:strand:+ start:2828 stop:3196 length:369 start_codon:yes stop_codon:yes gene_type:complete
MTNNDVLKKLRVALKLRDDEIVEILKLVDFKITKSELGAFFRKEDHPNYVECGDQILRNFLNGLVIHYRGTRENPKDPKLSLPKPKKEPIFKAHQKPGFKEKQKKKIDHDISPVKYKNKKKS